MHNLALVNPAKVFVATNVRKRRKLPDWKSCSISFSPKTSLHSGNYRQKHNPKFKKEDSECPFQDEPDDRETRNRPIPEPLAEK